MNHTDYWAMLPGFNRLGKQWPAIHSEVPALGKVKQFLNTRWRQGVRFILLGGKLDDVTRNLNGSSHEQLPSRTPGTTVL